MNYPTLRNQLAGRSAAMATGHEPADTAASPQCYGATDAACGVKFQAAKKAIVFPYSHFLFCEQVTDDTLAVRFATHRVVLVGERLDILLDELSAQRLAWVRLLPKRQREQAGAVWIDRLEVSESRSAEGGPRTPIISAGS